MLSYHAVSCKREVVTIVVERIKANGEGPEDEEESDDKNENQTTVTLVTHPAVFTVYCPLCMWVICSLCFTKGL